MNDAIVGFILGFMLTLFTSVLLMLQPMSYYQYEDCRHHNGNDYCYAKYLKFEENRNDKQ